VFIIEFFAFLILISMNVMSVKMGIQESQCRFKKSTTSATSGNLNAHTKGYAMSWHDLD
jgi:hypothetical protein